MHAPCLWRSPARALRSSRGGVVTNGELLGASQLDERNCPQAGSPTFDVCLHEHTTKTRRRGMSSACSPCRGGWAFPTGSNYSMARAPPTPNHRIRTSCSRAPNLRQPPGKGGALSRGRSNGPACSRPAHRPPASSSSLAPQLVMALANQHVTPGLNRFYAQPARPAQRSTFNNNCV